MKAGIIIIVVFLAIVSINSFALVPPKTMCLGPLLNGTPCFNGTNGTMILIGTYINASDVMNLPTGGGNNYPTNLTVTNGSTHLVTIGRNGLSALVASFDDQNTMSAVQGVVSKDRYMFIVNATVVNVSLNITALAENCSVSQFSQWNGSQFTCNNDNTGVTLAQIVANIGNWTADKGNYLQNSSNINATKLSIYRATSNQNDHAFTSFLDSNITNTVAANIVSTNQLMSTMWITGQENTTGTLKITHNQPAVGYDLGAFSLSLLLNGNNTGGAGGIFLDKANSTGDILSIQNGSGTEIVEMNANGSLRITSTDPGGNDFLIEKADGTDTLRISTTSGLVRTRKLVPTVNGTNDIGDDTLQYSNLSLSGNATMNVLNARNALITGKTVCLSDGTNCPGISNNSGYTQWRLGSTAITNNTQVTAGYGIVFEGGVIGTDNNTLDARNVNVDNNKSGWLNTSTTVYLAINQSNVSIGYLKQNPSLLIDNLWGQLLINSRVAYDKLTLNGSMRFQNYYATFSLNNDTTGINNTQLVFNVTNTSWYPTTGTAMIDKELFYYSNLTNAVPVANFTGITRALFGTTNVSHSSSASIIPVLLLLTKNETVSTLIHLADGRTGINTSTPTNALEVNGILNASILQQGIKSVCLSDLTNCGAVGNGTITGASYGLVLDGVKLGIDNATFDARSVNVDNNRSGWLNATDQVWLANNNTNISIGSRPAFYIDTQNNKLSINTQLNGTTLNLNGTMNVTGGNISFTINNGICLNENCSSRMYFNGSHTVIS